MRRVVASCLAVAVVMLGSCTSTSPARTTPTARQNTPSQERQAAGSTIGSRAPRPPSTPQASAPRFRTGGDPITLSTATDGLACRATIPSHVVYPGHPLGITFTMTNTTIKPKQVLLGVNGMAGSLRYYDSEGQLIADTWQMKEGISGPAPSPRRLLPGGSIQIGRWDTAIVWGGPLSVVPVCDSRPMVTRRKAPVLAVATSGSVPSPSQAVARAIDSAGGVLDHCRPPANGSTTGTVRSPKAGKSSPARCEAVVKRL